MLTSTQQRFVDARKAGATKTEAAIAAGLSPKSAKSAGSRMSKHPAVMAALPLKKAPLRQRKSQPKPNAKAVTPARPPADLSTTTSTPPVEPPAKAYECPKQFLLDQMNDPKVDLKMRCDVAKALLPYQFKGSAGAAKLGKKEERGNAAKVAAAGRFAPSAPPRLVANNR